MLLLFVVGVIFAQAVCPPEAREIPGLSLIGSGFNIVTASPVAQVLNNGYYADSCPTQTNTGLIYKIPNNLNSYSAGSALAEAGFVSRESNSAASFASDQSTASQETVDVSVCKKHTAFNVLVFLFLIVLFAAGGYGPFSAHGSVGHSQSQSVKEQLRRAETRDISVLTIQMHLKTADFVVAVNGLTLNRNFKESIQQLPITWDQNRYLSFVGTYGTHYQSQGAVGGNYKYAYSFDRASLAKSSLTESQRQQCLKIDAGASYGIPGAGVSAEVSTSSCEQAAKKVNREATSFTSLAEEYSMVTGGSPTQAGLLSVSRPTSKADWAAWISTIADNPALLNYKLRPIQGLLNPDTLSPEDNAELPDLAIKREHLERAIFIFFRNADATYQCRSCLLGFAYLVSGNCRCACWANAIIGENTGICDRGVVFQEWNDASTNGNGRPSETVAALTQAMNVNGVFKAVLLTTDFGTAGSRYPVWEHHGSNSPMEAIEAARQDLRDQGLNPDYWGVYYVDSFAERCPRERQTEQVRAWIGEYEQAPNHKAAWISKDCDSFYWASGHLDPGSAEAAVEQRNDAANYFQYGVSAGPECPESKMAPTVRSILAEYEASKGTHKAIALSRACDAAYWWRGADSAHLAIDNVLKDRPNFFLYDSTSGAELCAPDPIVPVSHFPSRGRRDSWSVFLDPKVEIMEDNCDKSTRFLAATSFSIGEAIVKAREYAATKTGHRYQIWRTSAPNPRCLRSQWDPALEAAYVSYLGAKIEGKSSIFWVDGFHCKENRSSENQDSPSKALNDIVFAMTTDSAVGDLHLQAGRVYDFTPGSWCGSNSSIQPLLEQFERFPNHKVAMVNNDCTKIYWWVKSYRSELAYAKLREAVQKIEGVNAKDFGIYRWSLGELCPVESFSPGIRAFWDGYQQLNNHKVFMLSFDCQAAYYYGGLASPETAETTAINSILLHNSSLDDFFIYAISGHSEGFCPESKLSDEVKVAIRTYNDASAFKVLFVSKNCQNFAYQTDAYSLHVAFVRAKERITDNVEENWFLHSSSSRVGWTISYNQLNAIEDFRACRSHKSLYLRTDGWYFSYSCGRNSLQEALSSAWSARPAAVADKWLLWEAM